MPFGPRSALWLGGMAAQTGPQEEIQAFRVGSNQRSCTMPQIVRGSFWKFLVRGLWRPLGFSLLIWLHLPATLHHQDGIKISLYLQ